MGQVVGDRYEIIIAVSSYYTESFRASSVTLSTARALLAVAAILLHNIPPTCGRDTYKKKGNL
jgi:hypothetical protein